MCVPAPAALSLTRSPTPTGRSSSATGWRCHLCGKRVRRKASRTDPFGATIDHLVPLSLGGADEPANVATAHYRCNQDKRACAMNEQLALL